VVTISRAQGSVTFPASFMLVASRNPCPCGWFRDPTRDCTCSSGAIAHYQKRISGPLLDRIDIHLEGGARGVVPPNRRRVRASQPSTLRVLAHLCTSGAPDACAP
jgi:predicted ATPase with chaperone activity